jgi:sugar/nucleoside kinase (ribokinase family)
MTSTKYDVVAVGNAIVDVLAKVEDEFLMRYNLAKNAMTLIDEEQAVTMYNRMPPATQISGGSAANTVAGIASFGGKTAFIGKVRNDELGSVFAHDLRSLGVVYTTPPSERAQKRHVVWSVLLKMPIVQWRHTLELLEALHLRILIRI